MIRQNLSEGITSALENGGQIWVREKFSKGITYTLVDGGQVDQGESE